MTVKTKNRHNPFIDHGSPNFHSNISLVALVMNIAKYGIILVDFSNKFKRKWYSSLEAIDLVYNLRFSSILMITFTIVLISLPVDFATDAKLKSCNQVGWFVALEITIEILFGF